SKDSLMPIMNYGRNVATKIVRNFGRFGPYVATKFPTPCRRRPCRARPQRSYDHRETLVSRLGVRAKADSSQAGRQEGPPRSPGGRERSDEGLPAIASSALGGLSHRRSPRSDRAMADRFA